MNICFEILLPKESNLLTININEELVEWGNEQFSQDPPIFVWNELVHFKRAYKANIFNRTLGNTILLDNYFVLTLVGDYLDSWQELVNKNLKVYDNPLVKFIETELIKLNDWIIITSIDDEQIDEIIKLTEKRDIISILNDSMSWSVGKGLALIYKK